MDTTESLRIFLGVAELLSFTRAAENLDLPKATVSTAVQELERSLGTRLFHRTTRKVQLTQDGQTFFERARDLVANFDDLMDTFRDEPSELRGRLRVDMPSSIARDLVVPRLPEFLARHPAIELELSSTDRKVDLVREGFDCVLRVGSLAESSLIARNVGHYAMINCVSRGYVERLGRPRRLDDLGRHLLVDYAAVFGERSTGFEYDDDGTTRSVTMKSVVTVNASDTYVSACLAGLGIIQVPLAGVKHLLDQGDLVEVLPQHRPPPLALTLLYAHRLHLPARVRAFMDWLGEILKPRLARTSTRAAVGNRRRTPRPKGQQRRQSRSIQFE